MLKRISAPAHLLRSLAAIASMTFVSQLQAQSLEEVNVLGGRLEQQQFDTPGSVQVIDEDTLRSSGAQVNLSDTLVRVPGVVALNRNNYAQDVQISIRGFGARASFGLRGIRLITDGIPATIPDGQGQSSTVSLTSASRIEVLTGPLAQLYGNSSGGVIQTYTREAGDTPEVSTQIFGGSFGMVRTDASVSGRSGDVGIVTDYSTFGIDGYRVNNDTQRRQSNSVITWNVKEDTKARFILNTFDMPLAEDPAGLTQTQYDADPKQAGLLTEARRTRKAVTQNQIGTVVDHRIDRNLSVMTRVYAGDRSNLQYQSTNAWVGLSRNFSGVGFQINGNQELQSGGGLSWIVGADYDLSKEVRQGGAASSGEKSGSLTRNEVNKATNADLFAQMNWMISPSWTATVGVRSSNVELSSKDNQDTAGSADDGSGSVRYQATSPVAGLTWHLSDNLNVYANVGNGFETPTLSEAAYGTGAVATFNKSLLASTSKHIELGTKFKPTTMSQLNLAVFDIDTDNELVVEDSDSGRTSYKNASKTKRTGIELAHSHFWTPQIKSHVSMTAMSVKYSQAYSTDSDTIPSGNSLPAVPANQFSGSVSWTQNPSVGNAFTPGSVVIAEMVSRSRIYANDVNTANAPGYSIVNLRAQQKYKYNSVNITSYAAVDNLLDKKAIGSVIVNASASKFFEPALPRNYTLGLQASLPF
jgi:iron complex outermembrane receptor protein